MQEVGVDMVDAYSKGLTAISIMATGLLPDIAYNIASMIEEYADRGYPADAAEGGP